ncbi:MULTISPECIES: YvrJ family protein [Bacillales]|nr:MULTISPECIES: YvrJ family protein [Bacillaceae]MBF0705181.1 YvrJ family protein [Pseudalkalibacillus hwajinpoensis]MDO6656327.1 YvrJ family protein [Anaerobacillus sp. 1_MG-2023]WLR61719.1 YvrJ family protein [Pseudalkalibacillus hwajinpoensis]
MSITTVINAIIGDLGFPIVVSLYLLVRLEKKIDDLTSAVADQETDKKG